MSEYLKLMESFPNWETATAEQFQIWGDTLDAILDRDPTTWSYAEVVFATSGFDPESEFRVRVWKEIPEFREISLWWANEFETHGRIQPAAHQNLILWLMLKRELEWRRKFDAKNA